MKKSKKIADLKNVHKRESRFATEASQEAKGTAKTLSKEKRKGQKESVKDSEWELKEDKMFAKIRRKKADKAGRELKALGK